MEWEQRNPYEVLLSGHKVLRTCAWHLLAPGFEPRSRGEKPELYPLGYAPAGAAGLLKKQKALFLANIRTK